MLKSHVDKGVATEYQIRSLKNLIQNHRTFTFTQVITYLRVDYKNILINTTILIGTRNILYLCCLESHKSIKQTVQSEWTKYGRVAAVKDDL